MPLPLYHVDAFSATPFRGNPAGVVPVDSFPSEELMQSVAAENNLSETAFIRHLPSSERSSTAEYHIRWFTPTVEVRLCGHATLAAAHVIFHHLGHETSTVIFSSLSGELSVTRDGTWLYLDFPSDTLTELATNDPIHTAVCGALPVVPSKILRGRDDLMAILEDENTVQALTPHLAAVAVLPCRGLIVTARGSAVDFVSRFFAPQLGIPEDPVTGSAHTSLVPYWSHVLAKNELTARQLSKRGGELRCAARGMRTSIGGQACTYLVGQIEVGSL